MRRAVTRLTRRRVRVRAAVQWLPPLPPGGEVVFDPSLRRAGDIVAEWSRSRVA